MWWFTNTQIASKVSNPRALQRIEFSGISGRVKRRGTVTPCCQLHYSSNSKVLPRSLGVTYLTLLDLLSGDSRSSGAPRRTTDIIADAPEAAGHIRAGAQHS